MPTSALLYKTGMSSEGTRHLMLPGADLPLCGVEVGHVFPGIGGKEIGEESIFCGNCLGAAKSNETKFRRPEAPRGPVRPENRPTPEDGEDAPAKKATKKRAKKKSGG